MNETVCITSATGHNVHFKKLYTLAEFLAKYGEDNCTIMLQEREDFLYSAKIDDLDETIGQDVDAERSMQVALDAWRPCDNRPPTELELMANQFLNLPDYAAKRVRKYIDDGVEARKVVKAAGQAEAATIAHEESRRTYEGKEDVGPPVTDMQQEPKLESFEEQGQANDEAVKAAQTGQEVALKENAEDYVAPTEFEEGGSEGVITEPAPSSPAPEVPTTPAQ